MSYLSITLGRESKRMSALRDVYEKQINELPKGSLRVRERGGKKYFYLCYRKDGKVISEYVGNDEAALADLKEQLERRKSLETLLKSIKNELRLMNKRTVGNHFMEIKKFRRALVSFGAERAKSRR